jgi:hypothetical protein
MDAKNVADEELRVQMLSKLSDTQIWVKSDVERLIQNA